MKPERGRKQPSRKRGNKPKKEPPSRRTKTGRWRNMINEEDEFILEEINHTLHKYTDIPWYISDVTIHFQEGLGRLITTIESELIAEGAVKLLNVYLRLLGVEYNTLKIIDLQHDQTGGRYVTTDKGVKIRGKVYLVTQAGAALVCPITKVYMRIHRKARFVPLRAQGD